MHGSHAPRHGHAGKFFHHETVVIEKLAVVCAVRQVAFRTGIYEKPSERGRVAGQMYRSGRHRLHDFDAIRIVNGESVSDLLIYASHSGISSRFVNGTLRATLCASCICFTNSENILSAATALRCRFLSTDCSPSVVTMSTCTGRV